MKKRFMQNAGCLQTEAEAIIFIGCAENMEMNWDTTLGYGACVITEKEMKTLTKTKCTQKEFAEKIALYNTVDLALDYCRQCGISSADIIYDGDEELVSDLADIDEDAPWTCMEETKKGELKIKYGSMDVRFYREQKDVIDRLKLINALRRHTDLYWLRQMDSVQMFLALAEELAMAATIGESATEDVAGCIHEAYCLKEFEIYGKGSQQGTEDRKKEKKKPMKTNRNSKSIIDLALQYAESIKKQTMTSFHLIYGYACICQMEVTDICRELGVGKSEHAKISYVKNKLMDIFKSDKLDMDTEKIITIIPQYIDNFEQDKSAEDDYEAAMKIMEDWRKDSAFSEEVVAYSVLYRLLSDAQTFNVSGLNSVYLKYNKNFMLEKEGLKKTERYIDSLEEIAKKSSKLYDALSRKIVGQDFAIEKFVQGYINAKLAGNQKKDKPAASYLFAGPPGVGKTFLARSSAEILDLPIKILDMSEYADEHSSNGLVGFEKTWRGSIPGVLTTFVAENPASIVLVDEIEKAHLSVQLLFLQILEGARLYDKYYEKYVNFENTIIIFTTNCGKGLYEDNEDFDLSGLTESEILDSLREDKAFPQELCSRFAAGNIIMFNHLQSYYLCDIVREKMQDVVKDIASHYKVNTVCDELLPELFLFHLGSGVDARIASARSAETIKDFVVSYVKDMVQKRGHFSLKDVAIRIKLNRKNDAVYSLFVNKDESNVLVISDNERLHFTQSGINMCVAKNESEVLRILREKTISFVLVDLTYGAANKAIASNALGIESVGRRCFDLIRQKAPQLPLYVVEQTGYRAEDRKAILSHGARGLFAEEKDKDSCCQKVKHLLKQLYIQSKLKQLKQKGQCVDYRMRYLSEGKAGVIELYDLSLKEVGMDDAALRRKSKQSKVFDFERPTIRFQDIIGAEQAKKDFRHFISYIQNMDKYVLEGAETPKGVLLYGPPGTGKTSLAKALAGECDALFLNTTGANIRNAENPIQEIKDLFRIAYANAPAILFIDEIDVIAKERKGMDTGTEVMVNTLLTEMEGFRDKDPFKPVFVVAATNYNVEHQAESPSEIVIDPALVRRFDNPVYVGLPSREERKQYIELLLKQKKYTNKISKVAVDYMAEHTGGRSFAFLKRAITNMTNMALDAGREVNDTLLTDTLETQLYGEKRERDEKYRLSVARHEAGHAYVSWKTNREPKFITIISRGDFGGYVSYGDGEDVHKMTKDDFLNIICQALAGRAAEVVYYGENGINTGASGDLGKASELAIKMICRFGMGNMGLLSLNPEAVLESPKGMEVIAEANKILDAQMERAIRYIKEGRRELDRVVDVLMDKSYIQGETLLAILKEGESATTSHKGNSIKTHKWYVVIKGRKPGIYATWAECLEQVNGYSNALYRAYETEELAKQAYELSQGERRNDN